MAIAPSDIIEMALEQSHTTQDQIGDGDNTTGSTRLYRYLNIVKDKFWSNIVSAVNEDFGWQRWTTDLVVGQEEYDIPNVASDTAGAKKLSGVSIAYTSDSYSTTGELRYTEARPVSPTTLTEDWSWYKEHQQESDPMYFVADQSIFIAPVPKTAVTGGIKLTGIKKIADWTSASTESDIRIPIDYINVLIQGLLPYIYRQQGKLDLANVETSEFERQMKDASTALSDRNVSPFFAKYPDEEYLAINRSFGTHRAFT